MKKIRHNIDKKTDIYYTIINREDIIKFTYEDYLILRKQQRKKLINTICEEIESYEAFEHDEIVHEHDKTYRKILNNPKQAVYIINKVLKAEIMEEEIEKYSNRYITAGWKDKEVDIIYKLKGKNIFFLIEHQSEIDYSMPYRLEEYKLEIIKSAIDIKRIKTKDYEIPVVIPIVIYTGKRKWKVRLTLNETKDEKLKNLDLQKYNLIDINKENNEELLNSDKLIDKIFLIEKTNNEEELINILKKIIEKTKDEQDKECLREMITILLKGKIKKEEQEKLSLMLKKEEKGMIAVVEMLREENRKREEKGRREGRREGLKIVAGNMLHKGMKIDDIKDITGLTKKEIQEIEKALYV